MKIITIKDEFFDDVVEKSVECLMLGGVIVYPTETCYGLGVDATNQDAVDKLLKFKQRPYGKAISVAVCDQKMAEEYVELTEEAKSLYRNFLPGPVTVISKVKFSKSKKHNCEEGFNLNLAKGEIKGVLNENAPYTFARRGLARGLASENETLGIRIPDSKLIVEIVRKLGRPVTATSANISSLPNPYSLAQWQKQTAVKSQNLIDLFIDAGVLPSRPSSTVIDTTKSDISVLRQGAITLDNAEEYITKSEDETRELAKTIINKYTKFIIENGLIIALSGDLGTGKTRFAQGVALALGIDEKIKSPTFTIVEEYMFNFQFPISNFPKNSNSLSSWSVAIGSETPSDSIGQNRSDLQNDSKFFHLDVWRLENEDELLELEFEQMLQKGNVIVIEWSDKVSDILEIIAGKRNLKIIWGVVDRLGENVRRWRISTKKSKN